MSAVYRSRNLDVKLSNEQNMMETNPKQIENVSTPEVLDIKTAIDNNKFDPSELIRKEKLTQNINFNQKKETIEEDECSEKVINTRIAEKDNTVAPSTSISQVNLERRLQIEEEVTFVCTLFIYSL